MSGLTLTGLVPRAGRGWADRRDRLPTRRWPVPRRQRLHQLHDPRDAHHRHGQPGPVRENPRARVRAHPLRSRAPLHRPRHDHRVPNTGRDRSRIHCITRHRPDWAQRQRLIGAVPGRVVGRRCRPATRVDVTGDRRGTNHLTGRSGVHTYRIADGQRHAGRPDLAPCPSSCPSAVADSWWRGPVAHPEAPNSG